MRFSSGDLSLAVHVINGHHRESLGTAALHLIDLAKKV